MPGRIKGLYRNSKFRTKLLFIFSVSGLLPILVILIISAHLNTSNMIKKVDELMLSNLSQIAERVNVDLQVYTNMLYQIYQDEEINTNIKVFTDGGESGYAVAYNQINNRLKQYNTPDSSVRCISVICADGSAVVYDFDTDSFVNHLWSGYTDLRQTEPYLAAVDEPGMVVVPTMAFKERDGIKHYYHIAKRVFDLDNLDRGSIATIVMSVDEKALNQICNQDSEEEQANGLVFIMGKDGSVIAYPDEDFTGIKKREDVSIEKMVSLSGFMKERDISLSAYEDKATGWIFYSAYDRKVMLKDVTNSLKLYVGIGIVALLAASVALLFLVRQINSSINQVLEGIREVEAGNLEAQIHLDIHDEIGKIADNFNAMTVQVKRLIQDVKEATDKQKNAEIRALEAQINPHFLYNTLDSINWMAIENGEYEISKMIRNLGVILRYSVNKSNAIVTIDEVADWLEKYVSLQRMRYENIFTYQIYVEERARTKKIHKLLLQPFIENAIVHGLKDRESGGILNVDIALSEDGQMLHIIIEDNGRGMSEEMCCRLNRMEDEAEDTGNHIGLPNVFLRLRMYYGEKAAWNVMSLQGRGTVITLKVPVME